MAWEPEINQSSTFTAKGTVCALYSIYTVFNVGVKGSTYIYLKIP